MRKGTGYAYDTPPVKIRHCCRGCATETYRLWCSPQCQSTYLSRLGNALRERHYTKGFITQTQKYVAAKGMLPNGIAEILQDLHETCYQDYLLKKYR